MEKTEEETEFAIQVTLDGEKYELHPGRLRPLDVTALRKETGMSLQGLFKAAEDDPDIDIIVSIIWLARRERGERNLKYSEVARKVSYQSEISLDDGETDDDEEEPAPE